MTRSWTSTTRACVAPFVTRESGTILASVTTPFCFICNTSCGCCGTLYGTCTVASHNRCGATIVTVHAMAVIFVIVDRIVIVFVFLVV